MKEAEILGDRIAIMAHGEIYSYGTQGRYLKQILQYMQNYYIFF